MKEVWKDIVGYEGKYQISNYGNVKSLNYKNSGEKRKLKLIKDKNGYLTISLRKNGKLKICKAHRLVAQAFIPNPGNYPIINHKDENPSNNYVDNLEWCTYKYNNNYGTRLEKFANSIKGRHHTEEAKEKISDSKKGNKNPMYGIKGAESPSSKKVECITTGQIFDCISDASIETGASRVNISKCCKGKQKSCGKHPITYEKLVWRYYDE